MQSHVFNHTGIHFRWEKVGKRDTLTSLSVTGAALNHRSLAKQTLIGAVIDSAALVKNWTFSKVVFIIRFLYFYCEYDPNVH